MNIKNDSCSHLQQLIHINMVNYWKLAAKTDYMSIEAGSIAIKTFSRMPDAVLNNVLLLHCPPTEKMIVDIIHFYRQKNLSFCWWLLPNQYSTFLCEKLLAYQFTDDGITQGMAMDLKSISYNIKMSEGVTFKRITHEFSDWITPIKIAFELTDAGAAGYENIYRHLSFASTAMEHYVAYYQNKPVATCSFFLDDDTQTVGIYNFAAIPAVRKKGISTALVQFGLSMAHDQGYKTAVLQATHFSENLFKKIGFESYTAYKVFNWEESIENK